MYFQKEVYKMNNVSEKAWCTGCGMCIEFCNRDAIKMYEDELGHPYAMIDGEKCVRCGLCHKICKSEIEIKNLVQEVYVYKSRNERELEKCSSGGAFIALSDVILESGGSVYGAGWDEDGLPKHKRASDFEGRDEFCGSKYVQSNSEKIYQYVKADLQKEKQVLFSGTPCQIEALVKYLKYSDIDCTNLYTVDIICHGVPSRGAWRKYLEELRKKYKSDIVGITFREKTKSGNGQRLMINFKNGKYYRAHSGHDIFYRSFLENYMLRPSCYNCRFASKNRVGDITLADFWGDRSALKTVKSDYLRESQIFINTDKGKKLFKQVDINRYTSEKINIAQAIQPNLQHPTYPAINNHKFLKVYVMKGFKSAVFCTASLKYKCIILLKETGIVKLWYNLKQKKNK